MAVVSEMPRAEQMLQEDDPDLLEAIGLTEEIRGKELLRAYKLRTKVERRTPESRDAIIAKWAQETGRSSGAWRSDLKWANAIDPDDLTDVFTEANVTIGEWTARIGTSHLGVIARAKHQSNSLCLTSRERAEWAFRAYDLNLSVEQLTDMLRDHDLLPPKKGLKTDPTKNLTACSLLSEMAEELAKAGKDADLGITPEQWGKPRKVVAVLEKLTWILRRDYPDETWAPKVEEPKETTAPAKAAETH